MSVSVFPIFLLLLLLLLLIFFVAAAQAAPETIAEYGTGAGQVSDPVGDAIDRSTGDLYVAEGNNFRVSKFDSEGNFLLAWGIGVVDGTAEPQICGPAATPPTKFCRAGMVQFKPRSAAVDPATGDVYVGEPGRVSKFTSTGQLIYMVGKNVNKTKEAEVGATQAEKDFCATASGNICGTASNGTGANEFSGSSMPIAIGSAGVVWVGDVNRLLSFSPEGAPGAEVALPGAGEVKTLAVDSSGDFYVRGESMTDVRKLEAGSGTLLETLDAGGEPGPVALDENDNVYIGDSTNPYRFKVYNAAGEQTSQFGAGQVIGQPGSGFFGTNAIAIDDSAGRLYAASNSSVEAESVVQAFPLPEPGPLPENEHVQDLLPTTVTLAATLNPEGHETSYRFEWGTSNAYGAATSTQTLPGTGFDSEDVEAPLEGLIPSTTYHFRLVATNHCKPSEPIADCTVAGPDTTFTTPPAVAIDAQWATDVTANSAIVHAELDPLGAAAEWWLEYGTSSAYGTSTTPGTLPASFGDVEVNNALSGLQPATTYHYRFVARDERNGALYTVIGVDRSFTTQFTSLGFHLADGRSWEMVSPPDKHGARLVGGGETFLQASIDGEGLAYQSLLSTEEDPEGNRILESSMNLAHREVDGSWQSKDITPPNDNVTPVAIGQGTEYKLFNSDLSEALVEPRSGTPLSPEASERTPYLRENHEPPAYTPLVTGKEPFANVPPGTEFGGGVSSIGAVATVGVSPNFKYFALTSNVPLVEGAPSSVQTLYEWSEGRIEPVSVLPAGEGGEIVEAHFAGSGIGSVRGALSEDGSRVFWGTGQYSGGESSTNALYVRDTEAGVTGRLDVVQPGAGGTGVPRPVFQGASADGTVVFFTDSHQLTEDAGSKGLDLYRCLIPAGNVESGCATLTDISVPASDGESAEVQGIAAAVSADGSKVYFVAKGVLDGKPNAVGNSAVSGEPNLYLWQQGDGVRFIATLSGEDKTDWGESNGIVAGIGLDLSAMGSPTGRYLAFMSQRSLTGYDNRDEASAVTAQEVYRYDAVSDQLECVSCNPAGGRPHAKVVPPSTKTLTNPIPLWGGQRVAATLPEATSTSISGITLYRPRAILDNGRVFFNAIDALVPADSNGQWDVYEYEPTGVGNCSASSGGASVSRSAEGCVSLVSSGTAEEEAAFFDSDQTGNNAFFFTPAQLSVLDEDKEIDIYDARVDGIPATLPVTSECSGEACQPPAQAPSESTPASAAFKGAGNLRSSSRKRCSKGKKLVRKHGRVRCVSKKHHRSHKHRGKTGAGQGKHRKAMGSRGVTQ